MCAGLSVEFALEETEKPPFSEWALDLKSFGQHQDLSVFHFVPSFDVKFERVCIPWLENINAYAFWCHPGPLDAFFAEPDTKIALANFLLEMHAGVPHNPPTQDVFVTDEGQTTTSSNLSHK